MGENQYFRAGAGTFLQVKIAAARAGRGQRLLRGEVGVVQALAQRADNLAEAELVRVARPFVRRVLVHVPPAPRKSLLSSI
jgi:hypothetical protein